MMNLWENIVSIFNNKLRFLTVYDECGRDSEPVLQYWNEDTKRWSDVIHYRCRFIDEDEYNKDESLGS